MKHCSSIDTDDILYKLVQEAVTSGKIKISGGVYVQGERPDDSEAEDIVINTIAVTHEKPQTGTSNVNIFVSDKKVRYADGNSAKPTGNAYAPLATRL